MGRRKGGGGGGREERQVNTATVPMVNIQLTLYQFQGREATIEKKVHKIMHT